MQDDLTRDALWEACEEHLAAGRHDELRDVLHGMFERGEAIPPHLRTQGSKYRLIERPGHPLARADGSVLEHRAVLYAEIGVGPHLCHWCSMLIDWTARGTIEVLTVDHLNGIRDDNRPENLVPSCNHCNRTRGLKRWN